MTPLTDEEIKRLKDVLGMYTNTDGGDDELLDALTEMIEGDNN